MQHLPGSSAAAAQACFVDIPSGAIFVDEQHRVNCSHKRPLSKVSHRGAAIGWMVEAIPANCATSAQSW